MRIFRHMSVLALTFALIFMFFPVHSQVRPPKRSDLPGSLRESEKVLIYKVGRDELRRIHFSDKAPDEKMLHTLVGSYKTGQAVPVLPAGNYLLVKAEGNKLNETKLCRKNMMSATQNEAIQHIRP